MSAVSFNMIDQPSELLTSHIPELSASPLTSPSVFTPGSRFHTLLALADDPLAETAVNMANILAFERGAMPAVVQVFDPTPYAPPAPLPSLIVFAESLLGPAVADERRQQLKQRLSKLCGHPISWPIKTLFGTPSTCIINEAQRRESQLVILGLHVYGKASRLLGAETALRVAEHVTCPVLAVTPTLRDLPRKVIVATDFSRASIRAAMLAARFVGSGGSLTLAYVRMPPTSSEADGRTSPLSTEQEAVASIFSELAHEIATFCHVSVTTQYLEGEPASALLQYADRSNADLIAIGSQRHTWYQKLTVGSITRKILRDGRWSVLVVPPKERK